MIAEIKIGTKLKCLKCEQKFEVKQENMVADFEGEYIICPHCKSVIDVQYYHMLGEEEI